MVMKNQKNEKIILSIDVVFLHTKNPDKLAQWYKEVLNIDVSNLSRRFKTLDA